MGCCASALACIAPSVPSPEELMDTVESIVEDNYEKFLTKYKLGMREKAPDPYVCEEVLEKTGKGGKRTLTQGVSTEEDVKKAAMEAATGEAGKAKVQDEVWEKLEPDMEEKAQNIGIECLQAGALKAARRQTDYAVEVLWDKVRDRLADKIKMPEQSETHATDGSENVE